MLIFLWFSYVSLVAIARFCSNFHHTLTITHCMFCRKKGAEGSVLQELCHFVILTDKMFTILLIVHVLWNQLLLQLPVYSFNTLQICYTHIVDVHEELICRKTYCWQIYNIFNLANFYHSTCSAYFVKSTPPRAFIVSF